MNARNCQLCGKPLGRLRGDGDFCSREHRNQYQLRAGMDRLVEVNKVASLMRRRESARPIPSSALIRSGATERHGFSNMVPQTVAADPSLLPLRLSSAAPRVTAGSRAWAMQSPAAAAGTRLQPRTHGSGVPILARKSTAPGTKLRHAAGRGELRRGEFRALHSQGSDAAAPSRDFSRLPAGPVRSDFSRIAANLQRRGQGVLCEAAGLRPLPSAAAAGSNLRVSIGVGFRIPALQPPACRLDPALVSALPRAERAVRPDGMGQDLAAREKDFTLDMPVIAAKLPAAPGVQAAGAIPDNAGMLPSQRVLRDMPPYETRRGEIAWNTPAPTWHGGVVTQNQAGLGRRNGAHLFGLPLRARRVDAGPQVEAAPFQVRDDVSLPAVPYFNVLAAASAGDAPPEPVVTAPPAILDPAPAETEAPVETVRYEEHFDSGWDNWLGGVADWKVDVAGVRTGSLALYLPTLDLEDYDLEFLTRIDTRTVNWAVHAANANSHLRCTITAVEGGLLEFSRALVRDGKGETAVTSTVLAPGKPRRTFTVRMNIAGPVHSISIDGKTIDTWVDDRLATGGIGFMSEPDDRARLYWVRVSSPGTVSKEQRIQ